MASRKMAKNDTAASDDAERAASSNDKPRLTLYEIQLAFNHGKKIPVMQDLVADPLHRDASLREREPIEELLKGLSQSPREDRDLLSMREALDFIQYFLIEYRSQSPESPNPDHELFRQFDDKACKELDTFYKKTVELIFNIAHSYVLCTDSPFCSPGVAFAQTLRSERGMDPDNPTWAHPALQKFLDLKAPTIAEHTIIALKRFADLVAAKREDLKQKTGPKTKSRNYVEAIIQVVEEYTGSKVKRRRGDKGVAAGSPLDVVHKIVAMMDPDINNGTIEEALKVRSKARGEIKHPKWW
jgi:hypothetical protein